MSSPTRHSSLESWLRLARAPGIGPRTLSQMLARFGSPEAILGASAAELRTIPGMGPGRVRTLQDNTLAVQAEREMARANRLGIRLLPLDRQDYPPRLRSLAYPPPILAVRGELKAIDALALTVVGPRTPSDYARRMTTRLVPPLAARGLTVVSGLAQGIDAEAHAACLNAGGRTVAILGQGLDTPLYPSSNRALAERILRENQGAILSPFALSERPQAGLFPQRNELLAALGLGLLVVEAGERSGALITARHALDFGRTVMALPGDADRITARGSNRLLAEGAVLVQTSDEVLASLKQELREALDGLEGLIDASAPEDLGGGRPEPEVPPESQSPVRQLQGRRPPAFPPDEIAQTIERLLNEEHAPLDAILQECAKEGFGHSAVIQKLLELEMGGILEQLPGRVYRRQG